MDVLLSDKTGTLTRNKLALTAVRPMPGFDEARVLTLAALTSSDGGQDPIDAAIRSAATRQHAAGLPNIDPATKMSEAKAMDQDGGTQRIVKGAFATVAALVKPAPAAAAAATELEEQGFRVLALAAGPPEDMSLAGLIALSDPPRADAAALVTKLHALGLRIVMVTGDAPATAAVVAHAVGLDGPICPPGPVPAAVQREEFAVFAGVLPEDKYKLVKAYQTAGHTVGMCGDGVNDAPALRQAQIGIAVSTATDVAKSAAGMVLTEPYTLNSIIKKIVTVLFLVFGVIMTGQAILTPLLMVIVMITGDFLSMSLTTDNVWPSVLPNTWRIGNMTIAGVAVGVCLLAFCSGVLAAGKVELGLGIGALQILAFVTLVFGGQATLYAIRDRRHFGSTAETASPSLWLAVSSAADILIAATLAIGGFAMTPLPASVVAGVFGAACGFASVLSMVKTPVFGWLRIG